MSDKDGVVAAALTMELSVECPECEHEFDLFLTDGNDEGDYYKQVLADDQWKIDPEERLIAQTYCPVCSYEFNVKGVIW